MDYDSAAATRDAQADSRLGSSISYSIAGGPYLPIKGFPVLPDAPGTEGLGALDPMGGKRKRVKINRDYVPEPGQADRLQAAIFGPGTFRPRAGRGVVQGRYTIFDIELV